MSAAPEEVTVAGLTGRDVEAVVRWYIEQGGGSTSSRVTPEVLDKPAVFAAWTDRERIGQVLAECPYRVNAGNPFNRAATVTVVERAIIADVAKDATVRQLEGCPRELTALGWQPTPLSLELVADLGVYERVAARFRAHPLYQPAIDWLALAFSRVLRGDQERGIRPDPSFLWGIVGT